MEIAKFYAFCTGLVYCFFAIRAIKREERHAWVFRDMDSTRPLRFFPLVLHDLFAGLAFIWLAMFVNTYIYGRIITLWAAHFVVTLGVLTRFTSEEGRSYAWIGTPFCLAVGWYMYFLALIQGVSLADIFDLIELFLDA